MDRITIENYEKIYPYFCARKESLNYWCDQGWLLNRKQHFFNIDDGVLIVFKRFAYQKNEPWQIILPPMTLDNDYEKEKEFIQKYNKEYSIILSDEDLKNYNMKPGILKDRHQFIYNTETFRPENLTGKKNRHWRNAVNYLAKNGYEFSFFEHDPEDVFSPIHTILGKMNDLTKKWTDEQLSFEKNPDSYAYVWLKKLLDLKSYYIMTLTKEDKLFSYAIVQKVGDTVLISCKKTLHSEFTSFPVEKGIMIKTADFFRDLAGKEIYFNMGSSGDPKDPEKSKAKEILRPIKKLLIYKQRRND